MSDRSGLKTTLKRLLFPLLPVQYRFTRTYKLGGWDKDTSDSASGSGSTLAATEELRRALPALLTQLNIRSMLDAPCGDLHWMKEVLAQLPADFRYHGADIVAPLIASLKPQETPRVTFSVRDIIKDELPRAELILCRDCLIHLSTRDIRKALANFRASGAKYLLTTTYPLIEEYKDIVTGRFRALNLEAAPFNFPEPLWRHKEYDRFGGKSLVLWPLDAIPDV